MKIGDIKWSCHVDCFDLIESSSQIRSLACWPRRGETVWWFSCPFLLTKKDILCKSSSEWNMLAGDEPPPKSALLSVTGSRKSLLAAIALIFCTSASANSAFGTAAWSSRLVIRVQAFIHDGGSNFVSMDITITDNHNGDRVIAVWPHIND